MCVCVGGGGGGNKLYGSLVFDQIKLHGWLVFRCVEGEERLLSVKKKREVLLNLVKRKR